MICVPSEEVGIPCVNQETIFSNERLGFQDGVTEPSWFRLVNPDHRRPVNHLVERLQLSSWTIQPLTVKHRDKREVRGKVILNSPLTATHNETELAKPDVIQLLEDELNNRLQTEIAILPPGEDRKHFFRLLLGRGKESRPEPRCWDYGLP